MPLLPVEMVRQYRLIYKNYFMEPTLHEYRRPLKIQAFDDKGHGYPQKYIVIEPNGISHPNILASCVLSNKKGYPEVCINVNPDLQNMPMETRKRILGHEWIHCMMAFETGKLGRARVTESLPILLLFNGLRPRESKSFWQDSQEAEYQVSIALRELLVSKDTIMEMLKRKLNMDAYQLKELILRDDTRKGYETTTSFASMFAKKWSVDIDLVYDRLQEVLFAL